MGSTATETQSRADAGRYGMLVLLSLVVVLLMTPWFSTAAVLPQLKLRWQLGPTAAAWLAIAVQLGFVVGALLAAVLRLPDRYGPRRLIACAACGAALANALLLTEPGLPLALLLRGLTGALLASVYPPALKLTATWFRAGRGLAMGCIIGALTLGSALPHLLAALGGVDWRWVIALTSGCTLLGALLVLAVVRDGPYPFPPTSFDARELRAALRAPALRLATAGYLGHMWELYAMWSWLLVYVQAREGAGPAASLLCFAAIAAGAPACAVAGALADRYGRTTTVIALLATSGLCAATIGLAWTAPQPVFITLALLWGASVIADSAQYSAMVTELGDTRFVGTALTAQLGLGFALTGVTIWLLPLLAAQLGSWQWVFLILVPGPLLGTLATLRLRARPEARRLAGGRG